ncbi:uncharacterized protein LOC124137724 isoform X2 [Haliotis rufescens]|uniref:uncharacterized protein LOC124137724 isoform X2 n=1 Tax=Haliotis rufescens TaxID=6454 RepID=UPI00201F54F1|nr:uncharacterized protein LOC124137724 isoform X2 [Haliotis rufescens]
MDPGSRFGVKLKTTEMEGAKAIGRGVTSRTTTTTTRSIRTPLKPANVKDLKAMFDHSKEDKETSKTKTETKVVKTTSTSASGISPRSHNKDDSGVKVVSLTSTKTDLKREYGGSTGNVNLSKETSSSSSDLLAKYRANRTGYYKDTPRPNETLAGTVSQSSPDLSKTGNKSPQSSKTSVFSFSANDKPKEFSVPRLNLDRVTSVESFDSASSKDDSSRSRSDCASPVSTGSGSPKLIGRAKPKYLPSPRSDTADSSIRVEIPVVHHSSNDETKLSAVSSGGRSGVSRFRDTTDRTAVSKTSGTSRFSDSTDKTFVSKTSRFGDSGDRTVVSKYSTEVKGPLGTRTKTVEITQSERKVGSPAKVSIDAPIPWSDRNKGKVGGILDSKEDVKVKTDSSSSSQPSWLEKKNARNVLTSFVSSAQSKHDTKTQTKIEREIPIQRIGDSNKKTPASKEAWVPAVKTTTEVKPERRSRQVDVKVTKKEEAKTSRTVTVAKPEITKRTSDVSKRTNDVTKKKDLSKPCERSAASIIQERKNMLTSTTTTRTSSASKPPPRKMSGGEKLEAAGPGADIRKMVSRKMSTERFQRLKFDFERGVPTESFERRGSEIDHIELKHRVSEIASKPTTTKLTKTDSFKRKEESIFASGLKVSDFVEQVNNLETNKNCNAGRKWKAGVSRLKRSSRMMEDGQENEYLEVGDNDGDISDSGSDYGIYEHVPEAGLAATEDDEQFDNNVDIAGKGRSTFDFMKSIASKMAKLKQKGLKKPSFKTKSKSNSLGRSKKLPTSVPSIPDLTASTERIVGSEEEDWETDSNSTTYEPIPGESLYEEADFLTEEKDSRKKRDGPSQSLGDKIKAKVNISAQATSVLNKIGNKFGKIGKTKGSEPPSISTGTDSDMEAVDEALGDELEKVSSLSRSSSERSSGKRQKKELSETVSSKLSEDEGLSCPTPPPLPPRSSRVLNQTNIENSPPLPPRNQSASGPTLDMVIPPPDRAPSSHSTGDLRRKGQLSISKDSYLHGQHLKSASLGDVPASMDHTDGNGEEFPDGYVDYDPSTGRTGKTESVDRRDFAKSSVKKKKGSFFRKTATADDRPASSTSSSGYIYPETDQWHPAGVDGQSLYQDLDDDQVYGRLGREMKMKTSKFVNEPLYQYYTKENLIRANRKLKMEEAISDDDSVVKRKRKKEGGIYEDVEQMLQDGILTDEDAKSAEDISPSKRSTMLEVLGRTGSLHRALWCEMPEVVDKGVLDKMEPQERKLQEAMFEIITSEASYMKSLNILITVFLIAPEFSADHSDRCVVTKRERQVLFSNIGAIRDASEKFLADLEERWQSNCVLSDICDIIFNHSIKNFEPYVRYTSNQRFQEHMLDTLKKRVEYIEAVRRLERNPECQSLPMSSFLLLPMQRITRLPLLVDAICHRLEPGTLRHKSSARALENLHRVVRKCNDGAKKMQQTEQMCILASQLDFKVKEIPLISSSRYIVKQGELTRISTDASSRIPFGKAFRGPSKQNTFLFLFNDMVMVTKKKGNSYSVTDYCQRNSLHVEAIDNVEKCRLLPQGVPHGCKNLFLLVMLENFEKKQVEMVLSCASASDRTRWIDAVTPVQTSETERIYEDWDCPQVQCVKKYVAQEPDELSLEESDVVNVYKKTEDHWYEGERIRDGERGWFPACYTEEIMNSHVRSRNLRLRYRLLLASQQYTETAAK